MKKLLFLIVALVTGITAWAQDVTYLDANGTQQTLADGNYTVVTDQIDWTSGWYVVNTDVTIDSRIIATGDVHLVLMDGVTFTASKGVTVNYNSSNNNAFTIYAQSDGENMGKLLINNVSSNLAGIGGENNFACGVVTINGGNLDIKSGNDGAAIGSGYYATTNGGTVIINGGTLVLRPTGYGAGIGGGEYGVGGNITINGGNITATGGADSAAIGGCDGYDGGVITINGGTLNLTGGSKSPAIGGGGYWGSSAGYGGQSGTITINGGNITAKKGNLATAAIGASLKPKNPKETDAIRLNWTSATDRYTTIDAGYEAEKIVLVKPFNIESTGQRATLADLESPTVLIPVEGTYHTVTYMVNDEIYEQLEVREGECAENIYYQPADKVFDAWYEQDANQPWNFETTIVQDLTLVAKYKNITLNTDETGAYLIGTAEEWDAFAVMVYNGQNDANAKLTADITQPVTRMIGTDNYPYLGTFDGQNHTLNINYKSYEAYAAPFSRVSKATIQNLKVAGTITTYETYASGMCGLALGVTITNCTSSVTIESKKIDYYIFTGGFIAFTKNETTTLTNCIFDGKMLGEGGKACAGFVADRTVSTPVYVSYCYFMPEELTVSDSESRTICRFDPTSMTDCYYTKKLGTAQGKIMAQMIPDEGVTIDATPTLVYKDITYYHDGTTLNLNYDLPNGKFFDRYTVNDGNISNQYVMTGEHVVSGFTNNVTITGHHVDSKISLLDATIETIPDTSYNKLAIEPELHVTLGDALLVKGEDYAVEFSDNINAGIATATIFGIGIYCDTTTVNFNILPRNINDEVITVECSSKFHYNGETVHPVPTINYGDYMLVADTDFELAYDDDCITIGDYNITVTGKGNYEGTIILPFTIMDEVIYREYDGEFFNAICGDFQTLFNQTALNEGWWVVAENATINERITVTGDVHIILMDGVTLTAPKGIAVNKNNGNSTNALTIYAQSDNDNMGKIIINDVPQGCAGIGGDDRTHFNVVTINGGDLDIKSGNKGAAIGSGNSVYSSAGTVIINGGKLMLRPNGYGAAIGGGEYSSGGTIIINGGNITAIGGNHSAGIGGCDGYNGGNITINGGIINATGNTRSAAIGGGGYWSTSGSGGRSGTITINGGQITATPGNNSTIAIGAAMNSTSPTSNDKITLSWTDATNDYITANGAYEGDTIIFKKQFYLQGTTTFATCDNIANATIVPALPIEETSTLAQVLEGNNGDSYLIGDNLAVAAVNADYAVLTDGNDWIKVTGLIGQLHVNDVITSIMGTLIIDEAGNPRFSFNNYVESEETVDWQIAKMTLATITEEDLASIESGQVVTFIGYYDYANEALRGWKTAPQGVSISLNTSRVGAPIDGAYLEVTGMISFKEAWDEQGSGAPKRVQRTGDATFQNLTLDVHSTTEAEYPTGIHNIMVDDRNVEGIYDLRGIKVTNPDKGIYIIRYNDGTAKKVRF